MSGGGTQKSFRKALGAIKDTTTVSLAKVNSDYKVWLTASKYEAGRSFCGYLIFFGGV